MEEIAAGTVMLLSDNCSGLQGNTSLVLSAESISLTVLNSRSQLLWPMQRHLSILRECKIANMFCCHAESDL